MLVSINEKNERRKRKEAVSNIDLAISETMEIGKRGKVREAKAEMKNESHCEEFFLHARFIILYTRQSASQ